MRSLILSLLLIPGVLSAQAEKQRVTLHVRDTGLSQAKFEEKYSKQIDRTLVSNGVGKVLIPYQFGNNLITHLPGDVVSITLELNDLNKGLPFLENDLKSLPVPDGSTLVYLKLNRIHTIRFPVS